MISFELGEQLRKMIFHLAQARSKVQWGLRIFSLSHARDKTKKTSFLILHQVQNLPSLLFCQFI